MATTQAVIREVAMGANPIIDRIARALALSPTASWS